MWKGSKLYALIGSVAAAALGYLAFSLWGGWREVLAAFGAVGVSGILIVLALSLVNYSLRFVRWQLYLNALGHSIPFLPSGLIYVAGFALTTTPGKAGEMLRGVFLKAHGITYTQSAAAFVSERLSDLVAIVLLALLGITIYPQGTITVLVGVVLVVVGQLLLSQKRMLIVLAIGASRRTGRIAHFIHRILLLLIEACCCHTPKLLLSTTLLSLLAWSAEAYAFYLVLNWMGAGVSIFFAFSVYALSTLAGAISLLPGGLGSSEVVIVGLLVWARIPEADAVAAAIIIRLATLWFAVALGGLVLLFGGRVFKGDVSPTKLDSFRKLFASLKSFIPLTPEEGKLSLDSLYGLRGIAALAIVLFHFVPNIKIPGWASFIPNYFGSAVQLFFVLSAFSLCYTTSRYVGTENWIDKYFWKRFFRIVPPFWFVLIFFTIHDHYTWGLNFFEKTLFANMLLIFNFISGTHESSVMAGWTIGVEVIFYAFFPMLVLLINSLRRAIIFFVLSSISLVVGRILLLQTPEIHYEYNSFIVNIIYFAAGMLAYWIFKTYQYLSDDKRFIAIAPVLTILLLFAFRWSPLAHVLQAAQIIGIYLSVIFGFLTVWLALRPKGIFASPFLIWCGVRSYSIYLVHAVIVWRLTPVYSWINEHIANSTASFMLSMCVAMGGVLFIAEIFHQLVEAPSIRFGKDFESRHLLKKQLLSDKSISLNLKIIEWLRGTGVLILKQFNGECFVKLLTLGVFVFALWIAIRYAGQPILESYGFRQTQTALTAFWMVHDGWEMPYQTPVAGYPWAIPFEFPIYQSIVALIVWLTSFSLESTGRLLSFAFLIACAWPANAIVQRLVLPKQVAWIFCSLLWSSPLNLFYGRTFMIETAALFFAFATVPYALDLLKPNPRWWSVIFCSMFATLAALQKITTGGPVIMVLGLIWLIAWWRRGGIRMPGWKDALIVLISFGLPIMVAYDWVHYSDAVKSANPFGAELSSEMLTKWNFGTFEQKLALSTYKNVFWDRSIVLNAGGLLGFTLIISAILSGTNRLRAIITSCLILFALPILIFTNLHLVHYYYQVGCMLFLIGGLSVAVGCWLPTILPYPASVPIVTSLLVCFNLSGFNEGYGTVAQRVIDLTSTSPQEKALAVGEAVRNNTSANSGIIVLGNDWDSDIAFYSQRKSFTVPDNFSQYAQVLSEPSNFLGNLPLGAIVICADDKGNFRGESVEQRAKYFVGNKWVTVNVQGCRLLISRLNK